MISSVCVVASDNVVFDGDLVLINPHACSLEFGIHIPFDKRNVIFTEKGARLVLRPNLKMGFKVGVLWLWHMVVLRKSHVYLTGALRK